jgi:uncharacterized membrane protein
MAADFYPSSPIAQNQPANPSLVTYTHIIYALHAFAVAMGILTTAATVVGGFIFSIPSIVAVIMNYARRSEVRGTWLESHFTWQIRTFWYALLWAVVIGLVGLVMWVVLLGWLVWWAGGLALGVWIAYRVARGWMALRDQRPMYL